jgi:hypothetical protein
MKGPYTVFQISAAMEERLVDIAKRVPKPRGNKISTAALKRRGLIEWKDDHFVPTEWGKAQIEAINRRSLVSESGGA